MTVRSVSGNNQFPKSFGDSRDDLGYGRLTAKYFKHRVHGDPTFPYVEEPTDMDDIDIDDEAIAAVHTKLQEPRDFDPISGSALDGQSLTGPNMRLGERSNTMSPIPDLYKNRSRTPLGTAPRYPQGPADGFSSKTKPTGDRYGYSTMYGEDEAGDEPAYTLEDIAEKQIEEIRSLIRLILLENQWV